MSRQERTVELKTREKRMPSRKFELGYFLIVTDTTKTEKNYFYGLKDNLPQEIKNKLQIKVIDTKTEEMIQQCKKETGYSAQYREPWIVFDKDEVADFDKIVINSINEGINVGWSNPCFEIWLFAYFQNLPTIIDSKICCEKFGNLFKQKTHLEYSKSDKYLYKHVSKNGDEKKAIERAKKREESFIKDGINKPSEMCPCTTVYKLISEIHNRIKKTDYS